MLARHNTIITDILGDNANVLLVTGDYSHIDASEPHITQVEPSLQDFSFQRINYELSPEQYDDDQVYRLAFAETVWKPHLHNSLLRDIADDRLRAFFISKVNGAIAAPYDGGIDFVLQDTETKDFYRKKYEDWLSAREDGL